VNARMCALPRTASRRAPTLVCWATVGRPSYLVPRSVPPNQGLEHGPGAVARPLALIGLASWRDCKRQFGSQQEPDWLWCSATTGRRLLRDLWVAHAIAGDSVDSVTDDTGPTARKGHVVPLGGLEPRRSHVRRSQERSAQERGLFHPPDAGIGGHLERRLYQKLCTYCE
jgi:hypothetical protein